MTNNQQHTRDKRTTNYRPTILENAFRWFYSFLLCLIIPIAFVMLKVKGVRRLHEYNKRRFERFGFVRRPAKTGGYLFHCVSVGEVVAASALIKTIMQQEPNTQITITTTTPTGSARVQAIFGDSVHHFYLPYDLHMAMYGMLKRVQPKAVMITEVELWPNMIHACWKRGIPTFVINARMTDRSARRYKKVNLLFGPMLKKLAHVCAQGERDYANYQFLGMPAERLTLTHNIKFDQVNVNNPEVSGFLNLRKGQRPILVAGSTHDPEESTLLTALHTIQESQPNVLLVLVPRHPERFSVVANMLKDSGFSYCLSSQVDDVPETTQVLLVDEMGKLNQVYTVASMAFVGGSLADRGGHNALEPAAQSLPILMGPHTYNNPVICQSLQDAGALHIVHSADEIATLALGWIQSPAEAQKTGKAGFTVLNTNCGALEKTCTVINNLIANKP